MLKRCGKEMRNCWPETVPNPLHGGHVHAPGHVGLVEVTIMSIFRELHMRLFSRRPDAERASKSFCRRRKSLMFNPR